MERLKSHPAPVIASLTSFFLLSIISLATNPLDNVAFVIVFICLLLVFIASLGVATSYFLHSQMSRSRRRRIILLAVLITVVVMLRSLQLFGAEEAVLIFVLFGISYFYFGQKRY